MQSVDGAGVHFLTVIYEALRCHRAVPLPERVRAGIAQARKEGRPHGRPGTAWLKADEVRPLKADQVSHAEIARRLGVGRTSVRPILTAG
jgi:DNA invertase Pin-like site-specific DNA recombinase